jgi:hypothetical protein
LRIVLATAVLAGCGIDPVSWYRADRREIAGNAALEKQFAMDEAACLGEMAKADSASIAPGLLREHTDRHAYRGCMARHGYVNGR